MLPASSHCYLALAIATCLIGGVPRSWSQYFVIFGLDVPDYLPPIGRLVCDLSEHALPPLVVALVVGHLHDLVLDPAQLLVQLRQPFPVLVQLLLPHAPVDRPGYLFDQSEPEEKLQDVEALLQNVLLLSLVAQLPLLPQDGALFGSLHRYRYLNNNKPSESGHQASKKGCRVVKGQPEEVSKGAD